MSYTLTKKSSPNYWSRGGTAITEIVIHHWGATGQSFSGVANWLCNPNAKVSAHYVVMGGVVCQILDESLAAWHAGNKVHNLKSIGIECRPEATEDDYQTVAELVADIWKRRGKLPLIRHKDIVATACPGVWDINKIKSMAEKIYSGGSVPTPSPTPSTNWIAQLQSECNKQEFSNQVVDGIAGPNTLAGCPLMKQGVSGNITKILQNRLISLGYSCGSAGADGIFGSGTKAAVKAYQKAKGLVVDGIVGKNTWKKLLGL